MPVFEVMTVVLAFALLAQAVAHRRTRRAVGRTAKMFDDNPLAMVVTRARTHEIVAVNSAYEKLLGWNREDSRSCSPRSCSRQTARRSR